MGRSYKRKTLKVDEETMKKAISDVLKGMPLREASRLHGVPRTSLRRQSQKNGTEMKSIAEQSSTPSEVAEPSEERPVELDDIVIRNVGRETVLTKNQENNLQEYLEYCSDIYFGLIAIDVRTLAYPYAVKVKADFPISWTRDAKAGVEWFYGFMLRHQKLTLRKPKATSLARVSAFNRANVSLFFGLLKDVASRILYEANNIWNMDETGVTTVHRPTRVLSRRGPRQVGTVTSAERGQLVTLALGVSAAGTRIPPFFVFPRKRFHSHFLNGAPSGSFGACNPSGWMNGEIFVKFLKHFQKFTRASKEMPVLLLLDNHESHRSLAALEFCRDNGLVLSFPPHCSHRLQPLDVSVFSPFKAAVNTQCANWMLMNPGRPMSINDLPQINGRSLELGATEQTIRKGFSNCGIWPLDPDIFQDADYLPSTVTDRPDPSQLPEVSIAQESTSGDQCSTAVMDLQESIHPSALHLDETLVNIGPIPRAPPRKNGPRRGRKPQKSSILTDDGPISAIAEKEAAKEASTQKAKKRGRPPNKRGNKKQAVEMASPPSPQPGCSYMPTRSGLRTRDRNVQYIEPDSDSD